MYSYYSSMSGLESGSFQNFCQYLPSYYKTVPTVLRTSVQRGPNAETWLGPARSGSVRLLFPFPANKMLNLNQTSLFTGTSFSMKMENPKCQNKQVKE